MKLSVDQANALIVLSVKKKCSLKPALKLSLSDLSVFLFFYHCHTW